LPLKDPETLVSFEGTTARGEPRGTQIRVVGTHASGVL